MCIDKSNQDIHSDRNLVQNVLAYIQQHLDDDWSLERLAEIAQISPTRFHRVFFAVKGETALEYIARLRLERAADQLKHTRRQIIHIALDAGYETHASFNRAFSAMFACSPSAFRRNQQQEQHIATAQTSKHSLPHVEMGDHRHVSPRKNSIDMIIAEVPAMKVAYVRSVGPYLASAKAAWQKLCSWAISKRLFEGKSIMIGICHDDPQATPPQKIRYDAAMTFQGNVEPDGDIGIQELPAGKYAMATHRGPYELLHHSWSSLYEGLRPHSNFILRNAPCIEIYHNDPQTTPPERLITDIYAPVEER
jgi:AraC family transcriptional regulator